MLTDCITQSSFFEGLSINTDAVNTNLLNLGLVIPGILTWFFTHSKAELSDNDDLVLDPLSGNLR